MEIWDEVIKEFARIIINGVQKEGTVNDFIGHIGGDDFVIIAASHYAEKIAKELLFRSSESRHDGTRSVPITIYNSLRQTQPA